MSDLGSARVAWEEPGALLVDLEERGEVGRATRRREYEGCLRAPERKEPPWVERLAPGIVRSTSP